VEWQQQQQQQQQDAARRRYFHRASARRSRAFDDAGDAKPRRATDARSPSSRRYARRDKSTVVSPLAGRLPHARTHAMNNDRTGPD